MNSVIISALISFGKKIGAVFHASFIYRAFIMVYSAFSRSWHNSVIMNKIKGTGAKGREEKTVLYKIVHFPFSILEKIGENGGKSISDAYERSFILRTVFAFLDNALSLNTRFYGVLLLSAALVIQNIPLIVIGIAAMLIDFNVTNFFSESRTVKFVTSAVGFPDISWDIYENNNLKKHAAFILAVLVGVLSGILYSKSLIFAVLPFAALVGAALVLKYPIIGIFCSAFAAPFVPTMVLVALIVYTSLCVCFEKVREGDFKWKIDSVGTGLGFFLIFMLISSVFSFSRNKSILVWGLYLIFVGYYFIIINAVKTEKQLFSIIKVFVIAGLFVSLYGIAQYLFGWNTSNAWIDEEMFENATMRAYSTMENPNVLGEYLLLVIPLSAFLMLKASFKSLEKWFYMGTFAASTLCMLLTQSRGCWIGLFVSVILFVTFYNGKLWGLVPLFLLLLPFVLPQTMIDRFLSVGNMKDSSTSYRVFIWLGTLSMLRHFWIGGIGMGEGAFRTVYPFYSYNSIIAPHSHNLYLQLLVEGGISALVIFLVTMILYIKKTSMIFSRHGKNSDIGLFALICVSAVIGFLIQSLFDYTFYNYRMMSMFFMLLGFTISLENTEEAVSIANN
ncbi:MAG: O-antigen ligase family protein [Clostridia bacterium]|nr:O-antigen ligase family protein [Clostridia bacterium]